MPRPAPTLEQCKAAALPFTRRADWQHHGRYYQTAWNRGWLEECCAHMDAPKIAKWTPTLVRAEARKYATATQMARGSSGAYDYAQTHGLLGTLGYGRVAAYITEPMARARLAAKGITLISGYVSAWRKALMACAHGHQFRAKPVSKWRVNPSGCPQCRNHGFQPSRPGVLYVKQVGDHAIKVGIAFDAEKRRQQIAQATVLPVRTLHTFDFANGADAEACEDLLLERFSGQRGAVSRDEMPDGFSETLPLHLLHDVLQTIRAVV